MVTKKRTTKARKRTRKRSTRRTTKRKTTRKRAYSKRRTPEQMLVEDVVTGITRIIMDRATKKK